MLPTLTAGYLNGTRTRLISANDHEILIPAEKGTKLNKASHKTARRLDLHSVFTSALELTPTLDGRAGSRTG
jgi:hypothetical protein